MLDLAGFTFDMIWQLIMGLVGTQIENAAVSYFDKKRIRRRVEVATEEVVEPLLPFLASERIPEEKQQRLIQTCIEELRPLTQEPEKLFQGSLDGQKIFDSLYANRDLPQVVVEDGLKDVYSLLFPRIATIVCKIPAAVKDWENEAWSENYRRFDEITVQLRNLFNLVDELATAESREADETLNMVRRALAQKIRFQLDITGLRSERPMEGKFEDFFVHPQFTERVFDQKDRKPTVIENQEESFSFFTQRPRTVITSGGGYGKSTWTKWFQREILSPKWDGIGIRIDLRRFASEPLVSIHSLIKEAVGTHLQENITSEKINSWIKGRKIVILLDGFDEIRPASRDEVLDWISNLCVMIHSCPVILTSRPLTTQQLDTLKNYWTFFEIEPFDEVRIIDYISRWYRYTPVLAESDRKVDPAELAKNWRLDQTIHPLTGNPLLLSTLLMVNHLDGSLPGGRSQLYKRYIEGMLGIWDDRRNVKATSISLTLDQKKQIIRGLALHMFLTERDSLDETDIKQWLEEFLPNIGASLSSDDVLTILRERTGLIVGPGVYSFIHKTIAEYLMADAVLQGDQKDLSGKRIDRLCLLENRENDRWNTVIFLWAGLAPVADVETFIAACIDNNSLSLGYGVLFDQFQRFPMFTKRRLLFLLGDHTGEIIFSKIHWVCPAPKELDGIKVPSLRLRDLGISSWTFLQNLLRRSIREGVIRWQDIAIFQGEVYNMIWLIFATSPSDIHEWKEVLKTPPETLDMNFQVFLVIASWSFSKFIGHPNSELESLLKAYQECYPSSVGLIPIVLISLGLEILLTYHEKLEAFPENRHITYLTQVLDILVNVFAELKVPDDLLIGTKEWRFRSSSPKKYRDKNVDLLSMFLREVKIIAEQNVIDQRLCRASVSYLTKLRELRSSIVDIGKPD